jgi:chitobiase/beta-hexosaminidase-like protein
MLFPRYLGVAATVLLLAQGAPAQDSGFNDGIPDAWRVQYFGSNSGDTLRASALADPDRDGANNYLEFITGTDPTDPRSFDRGPVWVATYVGSELGWRDGFRWQALLNSPRDMAWDPQGRLWFTETGEVWNSGLPSNRIRIVSRTGFVTTLTGDAEPGLVEGPLAQARFAIPQTPVFDSHGNAFIADLANHRVRKISTDGMVSTFAGSTAGYQNGVGMEAQFHTVQALCIDAQDNIYVADWDNICIRKITPAGEVSLFAGIPGALGAQDGPRLEATFFTPGHMAFAPNGDMFVIDWANGMLRVINPEGIVSTFATGIQYAHRVIVDDDGNIYATWGVPGPVTSLRKYRPDGRIAWTVGGQGTVGLQDGPIDRAKFRYAFSPVLLRNGNILISDQINHRIRYIVMGVTRLLRIQTSATDENSVLVSIETPATDAQVRYTTNGRRPTSRSALYSEPFTVGPTAVVKARLFVGNTPVSDVVTTKLTGELEQ